MIEAIGCTALHVALEQLKNTVKINEERGVRTVIFCEDRLSLAAERTVCAAVGGTFLTSVYTFARFLSSERGRNANVLSKQGSAMAIRRIIEAHGDKLALFKKFTAAAAAQSVYDTIALLYASRISAADAENASAAGGMLGAKLKDLAFIYSEYEKYLKDSGREDRNGYLRKLAEVIETSPKIKGNSVIFFGFQAFTCTTTECARAAFSAAANVTGIFIGGREDIYVNEALAAFSGAAEEFGGAKVIEAGGALCAESERLRVSLFNPESYFKSDAVRTSRVHIFEASDEDEELEFIAAQIKKHVLDANERYSKISVMLPDLDKSEERLARVFNEFRIPYYADRRIPLSEHPLCAFVFAYLGCVTSGCRPQDVDACAASPFLPATRKDRDIFRNYCLRLANFRGGVKRDPDPEILRNFGFDCGAVERVRKTFLDGLEALTSKGVKRGIFGGLRALFEAFKVEETLKNQSEKFRDGYPVASAFGARAYEAVCTVLDEAESLVDDNTPLKETVKILKSGFAATEISLIPPKSDAVFVGDLSATANTGSNVVFAARLTGEVPGASADTALLTDREIALLEGVNLNISPKIRQVNARRREIAALNICAFRNNLYLSYPARSGGEETAPSEIISYASAVFSSPSGAKLGAVNMRRIERTGRAVPYYCSERLPALKQLLKLRARPAVVSSVYEVLSRHGFRERADSALEKRSPRPVACASKLYLNYESLTPTALESYFACPYLGFMRQGLKVQEREEGAVRPVDTGNFIHSVLQDIAPEINGIPDKDALIYRAGELAESKLSRPPYSQLLLRKSGAFTAAELKSEAVEVALGMFEQLKNSRFTVAAAERKCEVKLDDGVKIFGRVDRVDECGDMVRIIDYKTGSIDCAPSSYYSGAKLQLPLYLLAASEDRRAVGAYYFPAAVEYRDKPDGVFRLQGFMDGSDEVVTASDVNVQPKQKSEYFDAYLSGRKIDGAMDSQDFKDFLNYSKLVAAKGAAEMLAGNVNPSPAEGTCKYCRMGGSCNFAVGRDGVERKTGSIKCSEIAEIARGDKNA